MEKRVKELYKMPFAKDDLSFHTVFHFIFLFEVHE